MKKLWGTLVGGILLLSSPDIRGADIIWTNRVYTGSWGDPLMWNTYPNLPLFDGTEDAYVGAAATNYGTTYTLDGNRAVRKLIVQGSYKINIDAGTPSGSRLILGPGGLLKESTAYLDIRAAVQIDDGVQPMTNLWMISGTSAVTVTASSRIYGLPDSAIIRTSSVPTPPVLILACDNSTTFSGTWYVDRGGVQLDHAAGFGAGTVVVRYGASVSAPTNRVVLNPIVLGGGDANFYVANNSVLTLAGPVSGPGRLYPGTSGQLGAIRLGSASITATGGIDFWRACPVVVTGQWTGCGNIVLRSAYGSASLQGNGTVGMASGKTLTMVYSAGYTNFIAPGDGTPLFGPGPGTVGTLTVGTPGNGNSVTFSQGAAYVADVGPAGGDTLIVHGTVNISTAAGTQLRLYGTPKAGLSYTLITWTGWDGNKFKSVYLNDAVVSDPETPRGVNGTHTLVYDASGLRLEAARGGGTLFLIR